MNVTYTGLLTSGLEPMVAITGNMKKIPKRVVKEMYEKCDAVNKTWLPTKSVLLTREDVNDKVKEGFWKCTHEGEIFITDDLRLVIE
jgi:hypothetical protein